MTKIHDLLRKKNELVREGEKAGVDISMRMSEFFHEFYSKHKKEYCSSYLTQLSLEYAVRAGGQLLEEGKLENLDISPEEMMKYCAAHGFLMAKEVAVEGVVIPNCCALYDDCGYAGQSGDGFVVCDGKLRSQTRHLEDWL